MVTTKELKKGTKSDKSVSQLLAIPKMISKVKVMQMSKHLQKVRYSYTSHVEGNLLTIYKNLK